MAASESGYLLIADITGYTAYLSASELEHAQGTLTSLLELLIEHTKPPLIISRLAGDAVISYALQDQFMQGQTFVEMIEDTYVAFRKAIERMVLNNTCQCQACANVGALDLKFFVHYGAFGLQRLGEHDELVGSDVIVIHRLLKNHVAETLGWRAYTLYTAAAIEHMGLQDMCSKMTRHSESYEHLGEVQTWVQDMHPVWEAKRDSTRITIPPDKVAGRMATEIAVPPQLVWDYLLQPEYRSYLAGSDSQKLLNRSEGRVEQGSAFQCFHGDQVILQTVLEWIPFELMTTEDLVRPGTSVLAELRLEPAGAGTRLTQTFSKTRGPMVSRMVFSLLVPSIVKAKKAAMENFKQRVEADRAQRGGASPSTPVPAGQIAEAASASLHAHD